MAEREVNISSDTEEVQAYCFRCRMLKAIQAATETRMRNGKRAFTGTCVTCGTRMFKIAPPEQPAVQPR